MCYTYPTSWAIFHIVGANPKMKSKFISDGFEKLLTLCSDVPVVPDHDLSVKI